MAYPSNTRDNTLPFVVPFGLGLIPSGLTGYVPAIEMRLNPAASPIKVIDQLNSVTPDSAQHALNQVLATGARLFHLSAEQVSNEPDYSLSLRANGHLEGLLIWLKKHGGTILWSTQINVNDPVVLSRFDGTSPGTPTALDKFAAYMSAVNVNVVLGPSLQEASDYHWQPLKALKALCEMNETFLTLFVPVKTVEELDVLQKITHDTATSFNTVVQPDYEVFKNSFQASSALYQFCFANGWRIGI